jgi:hypothetical protein
MPNTNFSKLTIKLAELDPLGLIHMGARVTEYDIEAKEIFSLCSQKNIKPSEIAEEVFNRMFWSGCCKDINWKLLDE